MNRLVITLLVLLMGRGSFAAEERSGTLRKIAETGMIAVGYHESSPPLIYVLEDGRVAGYSFDYSMKIVEAVKRELRLPNLKVQLVPITVQNRFSIIQNGMADIFCGATTNTLERQKTSAFSFTHFVAGSRLLTRKDSGIRDFPDLKNRTVVTIARSTSEKSLRQMNLEQNMRINIVTTFDRGDSPMSILQTGQADAYMMDDILLYTAISQAWRPADWVVTGKSFTFEPYGCILSKGDTAFKQVVDREIARVMQSGEGEVIYRKWMLSPIPPKGLNFNFPMSEAMKEVLRNPNDRAFY